MQSLCGRAYNATTEDEDVGALCHQLLAACEGAALPEATFEAHVSGDGQSAAPANPQHPWCCVRYVHVGKAAGTSFEAWVQTAAEQPPGFANAARKRAIDAQTFHHPVSYFLEHHFLQPACILGVTLRDPVSLFWSQFVHCASRRRLLWPTLFLGARRGSVFLGARRL